MFYKCLFLLLFWRVDQFCTVCLFVNYNPIKKSSLIMLITPAYVVIRITTVPSVDASTNAGNFVRM